MYNNELNDYKSIALLEELFEAYKDFPKYEIETWNQEYEAVNIYINDLHFKSRLAKKTPKKTGYFVAMWHKNDVDKNVPYNYRDSLDKLITIINNVNN